MRVVGDEQLRMMAKIGTGRKRSRLDGAKQQLGQVIEKMAKDYEFNVITYQTTVRPVWGGLRRAAGKNKAEMQATALQLKAGGGTNMIHGIRSALAFDHDDSHVRSVVFLTDGYIGNQSDILGEIGRNLGDTRIFSFGIGSSPNRYLLQRMADMGGGVASFIGLDASRVDAMDEYFEITSHPAMHNLAIDLDGAAEVYPANLPDVFVGRPVFAHGRLDGAMKQSPRVSGRVGGETVEIACNWSGHRDHAALPQVWARARIRDLMDRMSWSTEHGLADRVRETALAYNLASAFTSFLAVDSSRVTEGDHGTRVHVPVPVPEGVRYDTTVGAGG